MDRVVGADDRGRTGAQVSHPEPPDVARDDPSRPEHDRRMVRSVLAGGCLALALVGVSAGPALADQLVVDGLSVDASLSDGTYTAEIAVINPGEGDVTLGDVVALTDSCDADVSDRTIGGLRSSKVTLTFDEGCFGDASSLKADLDGDGPLPAVTIKRADEDHPWLPLWLSAYAALGFGLGVAVIGTEMVSRISAARQARNLPDSPTGAEREEAYDEVRARVDVRFGQVAPGEILDWKLDLDPPAEYGLTSEVDGLEAGWSFKDSWAANLTVATTAFVALLNSADTFTAVLGEEPEAALAIMTVAGLVSAVLIAVANTVAKLVGDSPSKVTTGGLILSTSLVVAAAMLQIGTVGGVALTLVDGVVAWIAVIVLTLTVAAALLWYAGATLKSTLEAGAVDAALPVIPSDAFDTWAATSAWQESVVRDRIKVTYADWLTTPPPSAVLPYPTAPTMVLATSPGDDVRASLI